jgi:hypothetical protein
MWRCGGESGFEDERRKRFRECMPGRSLTDDRRQTWYSPAPPPYHIDVDINININMT